MGKVAFVSAMAGWPWGGSEELWSRTALRLVKYGLSVAANCVEWPDIPERLRELEAAGVQITYRDEGKAAPTTLLWRVKRRVMMRVGRRHFRWLDSVRPDLVVISQGGNTCGREWIRECRLRGLRYVILTNSASLSSWPSDKVAAELARGHDCAVASFFVSRSILDICRRQFASPLAKADIVRNPFMVSYDRRLEWPDTHRGFRLACTGSLTPHSKGQDILFEVLASENWRQRPISVTLFGEGRNERVLKAFANSLNLQNVTFAGLVDDIESVWASHHGLVLPSRFEGGPMVVVEAMLCGRPCIATNVGVVPELIEDNVTGFIADCPSLRSLDDAMERAWARRMEWEEIGRKAAERAREVIPRDPVGLFADKLKRVLGTPDGEGRNK